MLLMQQFNTASVLFVPGVAACESIEVDAKSHQSYFECWCPWAGDAYPRRLVH